MGVSTRPRHWAGSLIKTKRESSAHCSGSSTTHSNWYTSFIFDLVLLWLLSPSDHFYVAAGSQTQHSSASMTKRSIITLQNESHNIIWKDWKFVSILWSSLCLSVMIWCIKCTVCSLSLLFDIYKQHRFVIFFRNEICTWFVINKQCGKNMMTVIFIVHEKSRPRIKNK